MKIILDKNKPYIECTYEEGLRLLKDALLKKEERRGHYPHNSLVSDDKKALIKKIFAEYPQRTVKGVAKELNLTEDQVRYWKEK